MLILGCADPPPRGNQLAFTARTRPSKEAIKRHQEALRRIVRAHKAATQDELIEALNLVITGWANYYRTVAARRVFNACDHQLFALLRRWARRRHPNKSSAWLYRTYWTTIGRNHWRFGSPAGLVLAQHVSTAIRRHVKVRGAASPFDGHLVYWAQRPRNHPLLQRRIALLLQRQQGRCPACALLFRDTDRLEIDHIVPRSQGGTTEAANLQVLHRHCHDQKQERSMPNADSAP